MVVDGGDAKRHSGHKLAQPVLTQPAQLTDQLPAAQDTGAALCTEMPQIPLPYPHAMWLHRLNMLLMWCRCLMCCRREPFVLVERQLHCLIVADRRVGSR